MKTWYLLFGGTSEDGMGPGRYEGRTTSKEKAKRYYDECLSDPYSTGYVQAVTDTESEIVDSWYDW